VSPAPARAELAAETAAQLHTHLTSARWFGGKGRQAVVVGVTALPWLKPPPDPFVAADGLAVRSEVVEVAYHDTPPDDAEPAPAEQPATAPRELYQLVVAYRPVPLPELQHAEIGRWTDAELGAVVAYDALQDPVASTVVLRSLLDEARLHANGAEVGFHLSAAEGLTADLPPAAFTGQQSNTSVMFGDVAMLKLFRRLELGRNLDIEVHDALSRTPMADVAQLFGWAQASWTGTHPATGETGQLSADLAMVVEKLADAADGWGLALDVLGSGQSFADPAHALGAALAETHAALRTAFSTGTRSGAEVAAVMTHRLDVATGIAPALEPFAAGLRSVFGALAEREVAVQRVHGDFHLGQTLHTPGGWKIIDFEGEPVKTLAERATPDSVWRDIGGMLRSFDYAAASVPGPDSRAWADTCRQAFLSGYTGGELSIDDAAVLRAYEADKAVYEVVYEVRNRPDWVAIPLAAVAALTGDADPAALSRARVAATPPGAANQGKE